MTQKQFLNPLLNLEQERVMLLDTSRININAYKGMAENKSFFWLWNPTPPPPSDGKFFNSETGEMTIPISGILLSDPEPVFCEGLFCSYGYIRQMVSFALKTEAVKNVRFVINSPGGYTLGMLTAAEEIRLLSEAKPTETIVQNMCCSAAYMLASNTGKVRSESSAVIGAVGVYVVLDDYNKALESYGISLVRVAWPNGKGLGAEGFSAEYQQRVKKEILATSKQVEKSVSSRMDRAKIEELNGEVYHPQDALKLGLIDAVISPEESLEYKPNKENGMSENTGNETNPKGQQTQTPPQGQIVPPAPRSEDMPPEPNPNKGEEDETLLAEIRDLMREQRDILMEIRDRLPGKKEEGGQEGGKDGGGNEETPPSGKHPAQGASGIQNLGNGASDYLKSNTPQPAAEDQLRGSMFSMGGLKPKQPKQGE